MSQSMAQRRAVHMLLQSVWRMVLQLSEAPASHGQVVTMQYPSCILAGRLAC